MKRISAIAISLLLIIGLTAEAQAVTSGVYKCYALQGSADGITFTLPVIWHYNPNATGVQSITRLRIFDMFGAILLDESYAPGTPAGTLEVNGRGSLPITVAYSDFSEGIQVIVNWRQAVDAAAPIPRLTLLLFNNTSATYTSVSQTTCP